MSGKPETAQSMERDMEQCGRLCTPCKACRVQPIANYEAGCMWLACMCKTVAVPDWDCKGVRELWEKNNK